VSKPAKKNFRVAVGAEPAERPISALRGDLKVSPQLFYGQLCFVVKDPVTLRYFRLQPIEHFLITQLDGKRTARDLQGLLLQQFPESSLTVQEVLRFVGMLQESQLLVGEGTAHAQWLGTRAGQTRKRKLMEFATNFLFMKVPLFHPEKTLRLMERTLGRLIFHPLTGIASLLLILIALAEVLSHTDALLRTPYNLLGWQNLLVLYCVFVVTKVFHEFGHGLTTKHFGGEVSQMGVMLFVFTPSFYCDTSDAWMIPSKAARLWINAGGIVVELVLAALAAFVWLYTQQDTFINQIALNCMISCSVATLFFNANPLMRYDGYYFLADYLEIPNLMTKGREFLKYFAQKYILGLKPQMPPDRQRLVPLVIYAILSGAYRWVVMFGIIMLLYVFFNQHGMGPIGVLLAILYVFMSVLLPLGKSMRFLWKQRWDLSKRVSWVLSAGLAGAALLAVVLLLPWNMTIREPLVVMVAPEFDGQVVVRTPGYIEEVQADVGQMVHAGDTIIRIKDPSLTTLMARANSAHQHALLQQADAEAVAAANPEMLPKVAAARTAVEAFAAQIVLLQNRINDLDLKAPTDGVIIRDTPLNRLKGDYVAPGAKLCRVVNTDRLQVRMSLPQQQAALVKAGMPVKIRLWSDPDAALQSTVDRVSSTVNDQIIHPALASKIGGEVEVAQELDKEGQAKSVGKRSTVVIPLPRNTPVFLADGMTGRAEITITRTTVLGRLWRMILDTTTPDWHL
jgi:putative peptide zinc metalloprotease protein